MMGNQNMNSPWGGNQWQQPQQQRPQQNFGPWSNGAQMGGGKKKILNNSNHYHIYIRLFSHVSHSPGGPVL